MICSQTQNDRRRLFWVTQPDACGETESCGTCGNPGLKVLKNDDGSRTISTEEYVRGLAINILGTDGVKDAIECGRTPGTRGGYWADSFRDDGKTSGSLFRFMKPAGKINEDIGVLRAVIARDLNKLVSPYGVAISVDVELTYIGRGAARLDAKIVGRDGNTTRVGMTGSRLVNGWVWK